MGHWPGFWGTRWAPFQELEAEVALYPVMNQEDLTKGLTEVGQAAQGGR
jgi:hypothetical protein